MKRERRRRRRRRERGSEKGEGGKGDETCVFNTPIPRSGTSHQTVRYVAM